MDQPGLTTFQSGGKQIVLEFFQPNATGRFPAVIVLHGARGIDFRNGYIKQFAQFVAQAGFAIFLVHYFDRTGDSHASDAIIYRNFESWLETVRDAVTCIGARPGIDGIGCFGYSLGGFLAVAAGARDPRIKAVVELAGGIDETFSKEVVRMPPTLILHGAEDKRVAVDHARRLEALLARLGTEHQTKIYEGEGHVLSPPALLDAATRSIRFLKQNPG